MTKHIFAIVGLAGSGKTVAASFIRDRFNTAYIRFGQVVLDTIQNAGEDPTPERERSIRNELREKHGMAAFAQLNIPKIKSALQKNDMVVIDGLYSWSEYVLLKKELGDMLHVIAIQASPQTRYARLAQRTHDSHDVQMQNRPLTQDEAEKRDYYEITEIEKAGPIVMAEKTIINESSLRDLQEELTRYLQKFK